MYICNKRESFNQKWKINKKQTFDSGKKGN